MFPTRRFRPPELRVEARDKVRARRSSPGRGSRPAALASLDHPETGAALANKPGISEQQAGGPPPQTKAEPNSVCAQSVSEDCPRPGQAILAATFNLSDHGLRDRDSERVGRRPLRPLSVFLDQLKHTEAFPAGEDRREKLTRCLGAVSRTFPELAQDAGTTCDAAGSKRGVTNAPYRGAAWFWVRQVEAFVPTAITVSALSLAHPFNQIRL